MKLCLQSRKFALASTNTTLLQPARILPISQLLTYPTFGFRRSFKKIKNEDYLKEMQEYRQKMGEMRKKHRKEYWEQ